MELRRGGSQVQDVNNKRFEGASGGIKKNRMVKTRNEYGLRSEGGLGTRGMRSRRVREEAVGKEIVDFKPRN